MDKICNFVADNGCQTFAYIVQFLGGFALLLGAIVAIYTLWHIHRNAVYDHWMEVRSNLYREFWDSKSHSEVRWWITSDKGYKKIRSVLMKRNQSPKHALGKKNYQKLEKLDRFLSVLARFREFDSSHKAAKRRLLWTNFFGIWIDKINDQKADRAELREYIDNFWKKAKFSSLLN